MICQNDCVVMYNEIINECKKNSITTNLTHFITKYIM